MILKVALLLSMLIQLGAAITAVSLIRRTRFNISWMLISAGFVLMALRRLFEFSTLFWQTQLISKDEINNWIGILISILMLTSVIFIRRIFNLQDQLEEIRKGSEVSLLSAIIRTEEKTRQVVAQDLHDGLGPILSSIKMTISALDFDKIDSSNKNIVTRAGSATDEAITALKEISNHLSPHLLKNYGLMNALDAKSRQLLNNTNIQLDINGNIHTNRYSYEVEINLFRIVSELMNNSIKHGYPTKIEITIDESDNVLHLKYSDDGKGFNTQESLQFTPKRGMGLDNIRSRVKSLKGYCLIQSEAGHGTKVNIQIPLNEKD